MSNKKFKDIFEQVIDEPKMRTRINHNSPPGYLVYILSNKGEETVVGISGREKFLFEGDKKKFSKLIYFEKFQDRSKAVRRKRYLDKLNYTQRLKLIKNKNPELLNLIFIVYDD